MKLFESGPNGPPSRHRRFELLTYGSGGQTNTPNTPRKRRESLGGVKQVCKFPLLPTLGRGRETRRGGPPDRGAAHTDELQGDAEAK
jgi:hypothetical protein